MSRAKNHSMRSGQAGSRLAHNQETAGATPASATNSSEAQQGESPDLGGPPPPEVFAAARVLGPAVAVVRLASGFYRRVEFMLDEDMLALIAPTAKLSEPHSRSVVLNPLEIRHSFHVRLRGIEEGLRDRGAL